MVHHLLLYPESEIEYEVVVLVLYPTSNDYLNAERLMDGEDRAYSNSSSSKAELSSPKEHALNHLLTSKERN